MKKWWLNIYFLWRTITSEIMQNVLTLSARGLSVDVKTPDSNVCRRQIQTSIDGSRAKRTYTNYNCPTPITLHRALCSLFQPDTDGTVYPNADSSPCKDEDLTRCGFNVGPALLAVGQYWNNIRSKPRVCWAPHGCLSTPTLPLQNIFASGSQYF